MRTAGLGRGAVLWAAARWAGTEPCRRRRQLCLTAGAIAVYVALRLTRQASAEFPENTLRSFAQAIQDGSEGIESGTSD